MNKNTIATEVFNALSSLNVVTDTKDNKEIDLVDIYRKAFKIQTDLTDREIEILILRMPLNGGPMTLKEIGKLFNISKERVRQIEAKAKYKISKPETMIKILAYLKATK